MSKNPKIIFYPVDNGNMIFIKLKDNTTILIDMHIRKKSHDDNAEEFYDVLSHLKDSLEQDSQDRYFLDAFILTHLDHDHIAGLKDNFYLGAIDDYKDKDKKDEKIIIKETWSSERFWKRETNSIKLSDDAKAYNKEMRRRANLHKSNDEVIQKEGDRAIIIGDDEDDEGYNKIIHKVRQSTSKVNNNIKSNFKINILGPLEQQENEDKETFDTKNRGSIILQLEIKVGSYTNKVLLTGDAEVDVCEYMNDKYNSDKLEYDILCSPHHCSMASLGRKKDKNKKGGYIISQKAKEALSHAKNGATIISSSKEILDDDKNPPHYEAKQEYIKIINNKKDDFLCTGEYPKKSSVEPIIIEFTSAGTHLKTGSSKSKAGVATESSSKNIYPHG
ncbi:MAG: Metallohydrolase [uncultured Sulfurovum sp.]|uniref:Metallohydrolase n=1 Tax=uncultured Sulfurovum sp. TaxID=269237 RepID=A0A6S6SN82_9BACT|nr:MAG: Metallohydrolase [uncultured Sulfurovum sp.]